MYLRLATGDLREVALPVPGRQTGKEGTMMTRGIRFHSGVFISPGARLRSVCGSEAGFGARVSMLPLARCNLWTGSSASKAQNTRT